MFWYIYSVLILLFSFKLCGNIKSWKRPQDLSSGTPKSFGFYEFDTAEGVLRALRLLTKLNIDGQELVVCLHLQLLFICI
jgi:RNA-binding protein 25